MMEYEAVRERQEAMRRSVERERMALDARSRPGFRLAAGTGLARLGLRLAGRQAVRAVLGEAR
jgi:hypothetical protein